MTTNSKYIIALFAVLVIQVASLMPLNAADGENPSIASSVPFFYYSDLSAAADWYENKLGFRRVTNEDWVVIFELTPSAYLGLVNASGGSLQPSENKGTLLSIETSELEKWWDKLKDTEGIDMIHGIEDGAAGMIQEFRMHDPEGYIIEFFRWHKDRPEAAKYNQ